MTRYKNDHYPVEWAVIAREIKEAVGYTCQECGLKCRQPGELNLGWRYTLTVAHYDGVYDTPEVFCVALCSLCHLKHDAPYSWWARRRHQRWRRWRAGQLELSY